MSAWILAAMYGNLISTNGFRCVCVSGAGGRKGAGRPRRTDAVWVLSDVTGGHTEELRSALACVLVCVRACSLFNFF